jgi:hypothetical protein
MAERQFGESNELVVMGLAPHELADAQAKLGGQGVDLLPLYRPDNPIASIKHMLTEGSLTDPQDADWQSAVDELGTTVDTAKTAIAGAELGRYSLRRMGPAMLNLDWTPPTAERESDGQLIRASYGGSSKYGFLGDATLRDLACPQVRLRYRSVLDTLAVVVSLKEELPSERARYRTYYR